MSNEFIVPVGWTKGEPLEAWLSQARGKTVVMIQRPVGDAPISAAMGTTPVEPGTVALKWFHTFEGARRWLDWWNGSENRAQHLEQVIRDAVECYSADGMTEILKEGLK